MSWRKSQGNSEDVVGEDVFGPRFGDGANSTDIHAMKAWHRRHQMGALLVEPQRR